MLKKTENNSHCIIKQEVGMSQTEKCFFCCFNMRKPRWPDELWECGEREEIGAENTEKQTKTESINKDNR